MGFHPQRRKKCFKILLRKYSKCHLGREKGVPKPGQKPIKCYRCDGWGHGWKECPTLENLNRRELVGAVVLSNLESSGSNLAPTPGRSQQSQKY